MRSTSLLCSPGHAAQLPTRNRVRSRVGTLSGSDLVADVLSLRSTHGQVLRGVIEYVAVDVVNNFAFAKRPTEFLFSHNPVNVFPAARDRAEATAAFLLVRRAEVEGGSARFTSGDPSRAFFDCRTRLGAEGSAARASANGACVHDGLYAHSRGRVNCWFSPACVGKERTLFDDA